MRGKPSTIRVARVGHPFFFAALGLVVVLALVPRSVATARDSAVAGYRLAGIVAVGTDYLGFLELPGGEQVLVRQGSVIEGAGRVLMLDAARLRIELPSGVIELALEGSGRPVAARVTSTMEPPTESAPSNDSPNEIAQPVFREIDPSLLRDVRTASAGSDRARSRPSVEAAVRLAPILNLPPNSRIVKVNDQSVTSVESAIARIEQSLADGLSATLNLASSQGGPETRVYVSRARN